MKIAIVGLGLMGASFAKTVHSKNAGEIYGFDRSASVMKKALESGIIDKALTFDNARDVDMLVIALYPRDFMSSVRAYLPHLKDGAIVTDFCGNKRIVLSAMQKFCVEYPTLYFVGGHPMAGREYSGIEHSVENLFAKASMILVPCSNDDEKLTALKDFYLSLGFGEVVVCSADYHDTMIAYTSQLCHIVSNAFIKNDSAKRHGGYSAGSYLDLTRVAKMNSDMWSQLMIDNRDKLANELGELICNLQKYQDALVNDDEDALHKLLEEGNQMKIQIDTKKRGK